jgi:hypothetical protein
MENAIDKSKIDILLKELDTYNNQNIYKYLLNCIELDLEYTKKQIQKYNNYLKYFLIDIIINIKNKKLLEMKEKMFNIPTIQERNDSLINNEELILEKLDNILNELEGMPLKAMLYEVPLRTDSLKN